ncbi:hypothetical protein CBR_g22861 [Chara braunii]|uniref:Uncharacterized protein n=1 Tax=Chara braunii TaxID=69332 RepID=A0A388L2X8_CHABU|nr:hypothetical protein CBR_g22861 [Chara braunii]|eukprot:GBG76646.1 hypothetical protein CBR_g22861 [Chara braunii]
MLGQYGSDGEVGGVSGDIEMASGVGNLEDRDRGDGLLDGDNMAEVFDARSGKHTFVELGIEFLLSEDREDLAEVLKVGLEGGAEDKDVIKVDNDTDFEEVAKDVVHGGLEGSRGIGESEWHHEELVVPEPRAEGGLVSVLLADTDLVEATTKVDLGKVLGSTETIKELGNPSGLHYGRWSSLHYGGWSGLRGGDDRDGGVVPSSVVTRSHKDDTLAFMSSREAVTEVWKVLSAWRMAERSGVAVFAGGCSPARLRAMLSTESVRMSDMLMEDAAMSGEEGVEDVA